MKMLGIISKIRRMGLALGLAIFFVVVGGVAPALAYDGNGASNWADNNWNTSLSPNLPENCTNFVSQALHAGGYSYVNYGQNWTDDHNWWLQPAWYHAPYWYNWSKSFT